MGTATRTRDYTFDDFCLLVQDGQKADLIDGVIYMASPDNNDANRLCGWLLTLMDMFVEANDLGEMFFSRSAFRLDAGNSPEPDIAFVRKERLHLVQRGLRTALPTWPSRLFPLKAWNGTTKRNASVSASGRLGILDR